MPDQPITHNEMQQMLIIAEKNAAHSESIAASLKSLAEGVDSIKQDSWKLKWFVAIISTAIIVITSFVTIIARGFDNRNIFKEGIKNVITEYNRERAVQNHEVPKVQQSYHY